MVTFKKTLISIMVILITINGANASFMDYDEFKELINNEDQNYINSKLKDVTSIYPSDSASLLTNQELDRLINSEALINLRRLELAGHNNLTDEHIIKLCNNQRSFKQLAEINLTNCKKITKASLEALLKSPYVGSIRNLPQISDRYGCAASPILVRIGGKTKITREEKKAEYILEPFAIDYQLPNGKPSPTFRPVKNGMKMLNIRY